MNDPLVRKREEALKIVGHLLEERDEDLRLLISAKELLKIQTKFINRITQVAPYPGKQYPPGRKAAKTFSEPGGQQWKIP